MYLIFKHTPENVSSHNRSTNGWEFIDITEKVKEYHEEIERIESQDYFSNQDGTVTDQNGNEVFNPEDLSRFDFGDYSYHLEPTKGWNPDLYESDALKLKAIEESNHWNKDVILAAINGK